jgi:hypothetical protein
MAVTDVHLVFKTHLDIGFTKPAAVVEDLYFEKFIPETIAMAREMQDRGGPERLVWTVGSWLIHEALERYQGVRRRDLEAAIGGGAIAWHALPFTWHTEYLDAGLVRHGLSLSQTLDRRFGRTTRTAKMTDVPGHTAALVPLLAEAGVRYLHVGVNPGSARPDLPPLCRWRHDGAEVVLQTDGSYGAHSTVPGCPAVLAFCHAGDNAGPPMPWEINGAHNLWRERHPGARVQASTMDGFFAALEPLVATLPVVEAEIGDTWIHGVGTDPWKTARFRALARWRAAAIAAAPGLEHRAQMRRFSTRLMMVGEHTWGRDLKDRTGRLAVPWDKAGFAAERAAGKYDHLEDSWSEQRAYLDQALALLGPSQLADQARAALIPAEPLAEAESPWAVTADPQTGALTARQGGRTLTGLARPRYQVFGASEYERFFSTYNPDPVNTRVWAWADFAKPGLEAVLTSGRTWEPAVTAITTTPGRVEVAYAFAAEAVERFGAPRRLTVEAVTGSDLTITLRWSGKSASRVPEALWLGFVPDLAPGGWRLRKLGRLVDPFNVVSKGARSLHAVEAAVHADGLTLTPLDAPLLAVGRPRLVEFADCPATADEGLWSGLFNTAWGTNFPMWSDEDATFRFTLSC